ncbi:unnamed protein product [Paramecium sonneborni]|uniref:Uncharacterized protein n=1 Tax=Paramecium sonneborni TaxID=65129 RepID=A0A8S1K1X0_9CILI|nr:unnamed protein product [Paramecium sonneborni]
MNQYNGRMCEEQQKKLNHNKLQRSVSPMCKLIVLKNLNTNENTQKSMRAKDDTLILDVILFLEKAYSNHHKITLYYQNKKIDVDKNTYLLPYLSKLKTQQLDYKIHENDTDSGQTGTDDESANLSTKLKERDSSEWGKKLQDPKNQQKEVEAKENYEIFLESHFIGKDLGKIFNYQQQQIQQQSSEINESIMTFRDIRCECGHSYNSQQLRDNLQMAFLQKQFAKCQNCNKNIPKSMYIKIIMGQQYDQLKLTLDLQQIIANVQLKPHLKLEKCDRCYFFCFWDKSNKSIQIKKGFCPICLDYIIIPENN